MSRMLRIILALLLVAACSAAHAGSPAVGNMLRSAPAWTVRAATPDFDFVNNRAWGQGGTRAPADLLTATNSTGGYVQWASGVWTLVAANTLRRSDKGLLIEEARTNLALWCRDFTNAAWVKLNTTAALTATGIDGVANSASTLTATAISGTALQTVTLSSASRTVSFWIKRRTGTGTVGIAEDGATFTNVASLINSSTYTQVSLTASVLNPVIGIQFGTSGDAVDVDFAGLEAGGFATSPILTTTVAVARSADAVASVSSAGLDLARGTWFTEHLEIVGPVSVVGYLAALRVDANNYVALRRTGGNKYAGVTQAAAVTTAGPTSTNTVAANTLYRAAFGYQTDDVSVKYSISLGADPVTDTAAAMPTGAFTIWLGSFDGATLFFNGYLRRLAAGLARRPAVELSAWAQ